MKDRKKIEDTYKMTQAKQPEEILQQLREKAVINVVDPKYTDLNDMFKPQAKLPEFGAQGAQTGKAGGAQAPAVQPKGGAAPAAGGK